MTDEAVLARMAQLEEQNAQLRAENQLLQACVAELERQVGALAAQKTPPPAWAKPNKRRQGKRERGEARRPRASEYNRARHRSVPTRTMQHVHEQCPDCGYRLRGGAVQRRREVLELPHAPVEVVEHQILKRFCLVCQAYKAPRLSFAGAVVGQGRIGVRLASLIGCLRTVCRLPLAQIRALLAQVSGITLSAGGIQGILARLARALAPVRAAIVAQTRASPAQHMDETGWRQDGQTGYVWVQATDGLLPTRVYTYDRSRAGTVARTLLGDFDGVLSTDFYAAYDGYRGPKQRCWAHLLRDAHKLAEDHPDRPDVQEWVTALNLSACTPSERARVARTLEHRVRLLARCYRTTDGHPAQVLATRLHRYESELFEFLRTPGVSPTNNLAERTARPQVIARKISGGTRSDAGSTIRCDLATVFATWVACGLNPFIACLEALQPP